MSQPQLFQETKTQYIVMFAKRRGGHSGMTEDLVTWKRAQNIAARLRFEGYELAEVTTVTGQPKAWMYNPE